MILSFHISQQIKLSNIIIISFCLALNEFNLKLDSFVIGENTKLLSYIWYDHLRPNSCYCNSNFIDFCTSLEVNNSDYLLSE